MRILPLMTLIDQEGHVETGLLSFVGSIASRNVSFFKMFVDKELHETHLF